MQAAAQNVGNLFGLLLYLNESSGYVSITASLICHPSLVCIGIVLVANGRRLSWWIPLAIARKNKKNKYTYSYMNKI
jgi:hypothetical protein